MERKRQFTRKAPAVKGYAYCRAHRKVLGSRNSPEAVLRASRADGVWLVVVRTLLCVTKYLTHGSLVVSCRFLCLRVARSVRARPSLFRSMPALPTISATSAKPWSAPASSPPCPAGADWPWAARRSLRRVWRRGDIRPNAGFWDWWPKRLGPSASPQLQQRAKGGVPRRPYSPAPTPRLR